MIKTPLQIGAIIGADMAKILKESNKYTDDQIKTIQQKLTTIDTSISAINTSISTNGSNGSGTNGSNGTNGSGTNGTNGTNGVSFKIVDTLPAPSLETFKKLVYCLDTNLTYICISNKSTPTNDDCFWVEL